MTKKTLYKIFAFAVSVITITAILILSVFYSYSDKQLKEQLLVVENVVEAELMQNGNTDFITNHIDKSVRITLVANDGTVIADNQEDVKNLDNHLQKRRNKRKLLKTEKPLFQGIQIPKKEKYTIMPSSLITVMFCVFHQRQLISANFSRIISFIY